MATQTIYTLNFYSNGFDPLQFTSLEALAKEIPEFLEMTDEDDLIIQRHVTDEPPRDIKDEAIEAAANRILTDDCEYAPEWTHGTDAYDLWADTSRDCAPFSQATHGTWNSAMQGVA